MQLDLCGKRALVTGSTKGIGFAIAQALHAEGCCVALNGRNENSLAIMTAKLAGSVSVVGDVTIAQEAQRVVREAVNSLGGLDILVCNVGSGQSVPPGNENYGEWQRVFSKNLWSTTNTVEAARDALVATKGAIICISSICGLEVINGAPITYSVAKAAINAYVRGIARPLGRQGVRINAVAPGNILFDGSVWARKKAADELAVQTMLEENVALRSLGMPADVANLVTYLASKRSGFCTGAVWNVDGGQTRA